MRILTVGDPDKLRTVFSFLQNEGNRVEAVTSIRDMEDSLQTKEYDCLLVIASFQEIEWLLNLLLKGRRNEGLLVLVDKLSSQDKVKLLNHGADDIVEFGMDVLELQARINSIIRRKKFNTSGKVYFANLLIDIAANKVFVWDRVLLLTKMEYEILLYLIANKHRVISKEKIVAYFWEEESYDASSYNFFFAHLKNLRKKLKDAGAEVEIRNLYKIGYQIEEL